jgi:hypothetical protein
MTDLAESLVDDDPVGSASARLLAAGLPLGERRQALRVLGALLDDAGSGGRLPGNPLTFLGLVGRLGIPLEDVLRHRRWLEAVGALERDGRGWVVKGAEHHLSSAVSTVDALDCIAALLGDTGPELATVTPMARRTRAAAAPARGSTGPSRRRLARPSFTFAGLGLAAAIIWVLALVQPPARQAQGVSSGRAQQAAPAPAAPALRAPRVPRATAHRPQAPALAQAKPDVAAPAASARSEAICPTGLPSVVIQSLDGPHVDGLDQARLEVPSVVVAGVVTNLSGASVTVGSFSVVVDTGSERLTIEGLSSPVTVEPGASVPWRAVVPVPSKPVTTITAEVQAVSWEWADAALATCRS